MTDTDIDPALSKAPIGSAFVKFRDIWWSEVDTIIADLIQEVSDTRSPLFQILTYQMQTGGKRLRAILPLMIAQSLGADPRPVVPFAAACELLHNASLVHDDIQDGDSTRRGNPTIWKRFGVPQAINLGDAMIAMTLLVTEKLAASAEVREQIKSRILREMLRVIEGQSLEFGLQAGGSISVADYNRMVEGKTSSLFSLPVAGAAVLSKAAPEITEALVQSSRHIGILFQIQDDILDLFGAKEHSAVGSDIREGKPTLLVVHYLETANASQTRWLKKILTTAPTATDARDVDAVRDAFIQSGTLDFALAEIDRRTKLALSLPGVDRDRYAKTISVLEQACETFLQPVNAVRSAHEPA